MLLMKVILLISYSNKKFGFRKIESYLASKIDFEIWKCPIFASCTSNCLTRYKQILSGCSLGCKNSLNITRVPMKFHNRGHTTAHFQTFFIFPDIGIPNTMPILICSSIWICVQCRWSIPKKVDRWRKKVNWIESARTLWCVLKKKKLSKRQHCTLRNQVSPA